MDANILIGLPRLLRGGHALADRLHAGEAASASAIAWYEFMIGPVDAAEVRLAETFIEHRIVALDAEHARLASTLLNYGGRKRSLKTDALIAATAIRAGAELLTINVDDFKPFVPHGLKLFAS